MNTFSRLIASFAALALLTIAANAQPPAAAQPPAGMRPPMSSAESNTPPDLPLNPKLPTVFIVGDSTARNGADLGWGDHLANYFDTTMVNIANRSRAGRSARSYMDEGLWDRTLAEIKPGDYVMLQWGHNDGGDLGGNKPRGDLRGDGDATQDVPQTFGPMAGKTETIHTYGWYNRKYVADIQAKGAIPMFLSMTIIDEWRPDTNGVMHLQRGGGFDDVMKSIADQLHLQYIDMGGVEADRLEATGQEKAKLLFPIDHTHTSAVGADLNAQSVVIALEEAKSPLVDFLKEKLPLPAQTRAAK